ncbi:MAG: asparaginase [Bacillota bacterium]|nr:asparaginase [Bacillota bacterium]
MKKILMITTGGTIASADTINGLAPTFNADELLMFMPEIREKTTIQTISLMSIDSTNMTLSLIGEIATAVYEHYDAYDGFVITHGTDTMAYTSAALVYMLKNLGKPVVITGSQVVVGALFSDVRKNLSDAFLFAREGIPGVFISFDGIIINGSRAMKSKSKSRDAFASINFPVVAEMKLGMAKYNNLMYHGIYSKIYVIDKSKSLELNTNFSEDVIVVKLHPGTKPELFDYIKSNYKGVVVESFGVGGIPNETSNISQKLDDLIDAGLSVVITTQCIEDGTELGVYAVGQIGSSEIINAGDMNTEAIVMKLMWALGNYETPSEVKKFMETTIMGDVHFE